MRLSWVQHYPWVRTAQFITWVTIVALPFVTWGFHPATWVEQTLASMTLEEKVGQLLVPTVEGVFTSQDSEVFQRIRREIEQYHVGGFHAFGGDPVATALLLNHLQSLARIPLLVTADLEGGAGYQFRGATRIPRAMALGATASDELASEAGRITATEGKAMGIHVNFYPVVDVNNNPRNPIINIRSFGEDVEAVSRMARAYIRGAQSAGQIATAKHFPGHGDTSTDSHIELPTIDADMARLNTVELPPFKAAIEAGVGAVMSAHIALPRIETTPGLPATLSVKILTGVLRQDLGFGGLVFTDAMTMRGVSAHFEEADAAMRAFQAGADIILFPVNTEKAFKAILQGVREGKIAEKRLDESVRRILDAKARVGLDRNRLVDLGRLDEVLGSAANQRIARTMIERGLTLVRDEKNWLPLKLKDNSEVLYVNLIDSAEGFREGAPGTTFRNELRRRHPKTIDVQASDRTSAGEFDLIRKLITASDVVIVNGFIRVAAYKGSINLTEAQLGLLKHLSQLDKPMIFTLFGSPYLLSFVPELPTLVLTYEYYPEAELAALRAMLGEIEYRGHLPISLPGAYPIGHGLYRSLQITH